MMTGIFLPLLALVTGMTIGAFYFAGLWWTVKRIAQSRRPFLWTLASFFLRGLLSLIGFYLAGGGDWARIVICLIGFLIARHLLVRRWRPKIDRDCPEKRPSYGY